MPILLQLKDDSRYGSIGSRERKETLYFFSLLDQIAAFAKPERPCRSGNRQAMPTIVIATVLAMAPEAAASGPHCNAISAVPAAITAVKISRSRVLN